MGWHGNGDGTDGGVGNCLMSVWDRRKEILHDRGSVGEVSKTSPTPECKVNGTECYGG